MYKLKQAKKAKKDYEHAARRGFAKLLSEFFDTVENDPYEDTPGHFYEELKGNLKGIHTRRLDYHNRFAYQILPNDDNLTHPETGEVYEGIVKIINMWGHFPPKW